MPRICTTIDIQAPPDRVWAAVRDIERWSERTPTVISVQPLDPGPLAVGTRAIVRQPQLLPARHAIEDAVNGCRATLSLDFSGPRGPLCARLIRGLNGRYLAAEARGLNKHAEAGSR